MVLVGDASKLCRRQYTAMALQAHAPDPNGPCGGRLKEKIRLVACNLNTPTWTRDACRHSPTLLPALARLPRPHDAVGPVRDPRPRAVRAPQLPEPHVDPQRGRHQVGHR